MPTKGFTLSGYFGPDMEFIEAKPDSHPPAPNGAGTMQVLTATRTGWDGRDGAPIFTVVSDELGVIGKYDEDDNRGLREAAIQALAEAWGDLA